MINGGLEGALEESLEVVGLSRVELRELVLLIVGIAVVRLLMGRRFIAH